MQVGFTNSYASVPRQPRIDHPGHRSATTNPASPHVSRTQSVNLASVDLNLLVALDVLLEHRNVTHAAQRVGLSQPAMSRALSRLRGMFEDDLLVRTSAGLVHTPRGADLHARLPSALRAIRHLMTDRFGHADPRQPPLRIAMPDHQALVLLPHLLQRLGAGEGRTEVMFEPLPNAFKRLETGEIDFAIGEVGFASPGFFQRHLYSDRYACLLRRGHPALSGAWTAEAFYAERHVMVDPGPDSEAERVFDPLSRLLRDRDRLVLPNTMSAPMIVAESDFVLTVPRRAAIRMAAMLPLTVVELPVPAEAYRLKLLWHERSHRQAEHVFLRSEIAAAAQFGGPPDAHWKPPHPA